MSAAELLEVFLCGLIVFALAYQRLWAPLVVGDGLLLFFGALPAWLFPADLGGK